MTIEAFDHPTAHHGPETSFEDFALSKFAFYPGPSAYLPRRALVFNLTLRPNGPRAEWYRSQIAEHLPVLRESKCERVAELFAETLQQVLGLGIGLPCRDWAVLPDDDAETIAVEALDEIVAEDAARMVSEWFRTINDDDYFPFDERLRALQDCFDRSRYGGPTIYSLIEAGMKRGIPVLYLREEDTFQWGYGRKALRARSTVLHTDSVRDTEFTTQKDQVKGWLDAFGFPTPQGILAFEEAEAIAEAEVLGYPVVVKPVAGHKGQGVRTNLFTAADVAEAFRALATNEAFDGAIVEQQINGSDFRLLAVNGEFAAALERAPASVVGDGRHSIEELIREENSRPEREDTIRSPLAKIVVDEEMERWLRAQNLSLRNVPAEGDVVVLRRVANISAGGRSINVTERIHPLNKKLVSDIAKFLKLTCFGIDVIAEDIAKPWTEGNFGIIEINAGPGIFMHIAPSVGDPIDVPGMVIESHFPRPECARIPIVAGNFMTTEFCDKLAARIRSFDATRNVVSLTGTKVRFNGEPLSRPVSHMKALEMALRHPAADVAVLEHTNDDLLDDGTLHEGADVVILDHPYDTESELAKHLLPGGFLIAVNETDVVAMQDGLEEVARLPLRDPAALDEIVLAVLTPLLPELLAKYER
ncbi:MAG: acetate--CoA ligase family protein [Sumerlaeia bacterium]